MKKIFYRIAKVVARPIIIKDTCGTSINYSTVEAKMILKLADKIKSTGATHVCIECSSEGGFRLGRAIVEFTPAVVSDDIVEFKHGRAKGEEAFGKEMVDYVKISSE